MTIDLDNEEKIEERVEGLRESAYGLTEMIRSLKKDTGKNAWDEIVEYILEKKENTENE